MRQVEFLATPKNIVIEEMVVYQDIDREDVKYIKCGE